MNPKQRSLALSAAQTAARRLLVRAIDLRFNLDEAAERADGDHGLTPQDLWQLRADADALCGALDALADTLGPSTADGSKVDEEETAGVLRSPA